MNLLLQWLFIFYLLGMLVCTVLVFIGIFFTKEGDDLFFKYYNNFEGKAKGLIWLILLILEMIILWPRAFYLLLKSKRK